MITCYIVDDEKKSASLIKKYVTRTPGLKLLDIETNALKAFHALTSQTIKPDVVFMDIIMPDIKGTELAKQVVADTRIIFTSGMPDYALEAFEIGAVDFLEKPINYERFLLAISRIFKKPEQYDTRTEESFFIKGVRKGVVQRIDIKNILFVQSSHNYSYIYLHDNSKNMVYMSLQEMEMALPDNVFVRVHKSYIINLNMVEKVVGSQIFLLGCDKVINCGLQYRDFFLEAIGKRLLYKKNRNL